MASEKLSVKFVERKTDEPGRYADGNGLYLQVTPTGAKSWIFRYERGGKERMLGLGPLHTFSLDEARERARLARQKLADGVDPVEASKVAKASAALATSKRLTFKEAATQYDHLHRTKWKNAKAAAQFLSTLETYAYPVIGALSVQDIDTGHILKIIEPMWTKKTETASRVRQRIERVLSWATVRNYRQGDNPARWAGHLREALPSRGQIAQVRNHPALPYAEAPAFMAALRKREGSGARALEFTVLTAARTGEVTGARWSEIDFDERLWTIPKDRMKAGREHRVPLSDHALAVLSALPREDGNDFLFVGTTKGAGLSNMSLAAVLKRMDISPDRATVHGFRSCFRDWASERTSYANEVIEKALAHAVKDKTEAAYRRGDLLDKRVRLMADWAEYCSAVPAAGKVTPIRGRA